MLNAINHGKAGRMGWAGQISTCNPDLQVACKALSMVAILSGITTPFSDKI